MKIPQLEPNTAVFSSHNITIKDHYSYYIIIVPAFKRGSYILMYTLAVMNTIRHKGFNRHNNILNVCNNDYNSFLIHSLHCIIILCIICKSNIIIEQF